MSETTQRGWYARLMDADLSGETALVVVLRARASAPGGAAA